MTAPTTIDASTGELVQANATILAQEAAALTHAVDVAKRYPRSNLEFKSSLMEWAALNEEVAVSCYFSVTKGGETIVGPSARFAELVTCAWKNIDIQTRIIGEEDGCIVVEGAARDAECNVTRRDQVRRPITKRDGSRYAQHVVETTIAAGLSIAARNAVLKVVPQALWGPIFKEVRAVAAGKGQTLEQRRSAAFKYLTEDLKVPEERLYTLLDGRKTPDWTIDDILALKAKAQLLKDGEATIDSAFPEKLEKDSGSAKDSRDAANAALSGLRKPEGERPAQGDTGAQEETYRPTAANDAIGDAEAAGEPEVCLKQDATGARCVIGGSHTKHQNKEGFWEVAPEPASEEPDAEETSIGKGEPDFFDE